MIPCPVTDLLSVEAGEVGVVSKEGVFSVKTLLIKFREKLQYERNGKTVPSEISSYSLLKIFQFGSRFV